MRRGVVTPPYGCITGSAQQRAAGSSAPTVRRGRLPTTRASGAQRSVCAADGRDGWESRQRSPQKGPSTPDNPSVSLRLTAPFTQGSLWGRGCGLPRRPVGPPRNDKGFLSFRGAERRGNPFFLRWTRGGTPGSSCPTGVAEGLINHPGESAHSGAIAAAAARNDQKSTQRPSKRATTPAALSEAESAERAAGQIRFLPDTLRVQHGVHGSEVC